MSKLDRMVTFVRVVEEGSLAAAARALGLSNAAVSKQISYLETEIGVTLLKRTTRSLELTEAGQIYFRQCQRVKAEVAESDHLISSWHDEPYGVLRVVAGRYFGERYVVPSLGEFLRRYPKVMLELELAERSPDLLKEKVDVVIGMSIPGHPDSIQKTIAKTRYVLCASPAYLAQFGKPMVVQELSRHRYITHSGRNPDDVLVVGNQSVRVSPILRLNDAHAMLQCALMGIGIVKLHEYLVADALRTSALVPIWPDLPEPEVPIYLGYQGSRYLSPKIRHFIDFIVARLALG